MKKEPVRILLAGLAGVIDLGLIAAARLELVALDAGDIAAIVAFVTAACALAAAMIRSRMDSPATVEAKVVEALHRQMIPQTAPPHVMASHVASVGRVVAARKDAP